MIGSPSPHAATGFQQLGMRLEPPADDDPFPLSIFDCLLQQLGFLVDFRSASSVGVAAQNQTRRLDVVAAGLLSAVVQLEPPVIPTPAMILHRFQQPS